MNNADRLNLCRKYFFIGCFGLPFLWIVNSIWFGSYLLSTNRRLKRENSDQNDEAFVQTKKHLQDLFSYVLYSSIGGLVWIVVAIIWINIFQLKRAEWGEFGDSISFNIPRGIA